MLTSEQNYLGRPFFPKPTDPYRALRPRSLLVYRLQNPCAPQFFPGRRMWISTDETILRRYGALAGFEPTSGPSTGIYRGVQTL